MRSKIVELTLLTIIATLVAVIGVAVEAHPGGQDVCGGHFGGQFPTYHTHDNRKLKNCKRIMNLVREEEKIRFIIGDGVDNKTVMVK